MSYSSEVLADSPRLYYRMGEASGFLTDSSGNSLTSSGWTNTPTYGATGAITTDPTDDAIDFTSNARTSTADNALLDLGDVFTMEVWVKRNSTLSTVQMLMSKGTNAYSMLFNAANNVEFNKSGVSIVAASTTTITDALWHHLAVTKTGSTVKIYIDAVDVTGTVTNATFTDSSDVLGIGQEASGFLYHGVMDELAVYPTALSAARVLAHYQAATGVTDDVIVNVSVNF